MLPGVESVLSVLKTAGVGCRKGEYRYPPDSDFLKLSKHVQ